MNGGCTRCLKMGCECVLISPRELAEVREDVAFYREWSNELAMNVPEEYDDDVAQEAIISKWAKDMATAVKRLRAQETRIRAAVDVLATAQRLLLGTYDNDYRDIARGLGEAIEAILAALDTEENE